MREDFLDLFRRFHNLNLLTLIEDLRVGRVAFDAFLSESGLMCPLQHGGNEHEQVYRQCIEEHDFTPEGILLRGFIGWWDLGTRREHLLRALEAIWAERLADAMAVQAVCEPAVEEVAR